MQFSSAIILTLLPLTLGSGMPPCHTPAPPPRYCSLLGGANSTSNCLSEEVCMPNPSANATSAATAGVCVGRSCGSFVPSDALDCRPCPVGQFCAFNFTFMPDYPGSCVLPTMECAGTSGKTCPDGGPRGWRCTASGDTKCGNPNATCAGYCTPA